MSPTSAEERANQRNALLAGFLGWTLDAFDFFILTFVLAPIAHEFHLDLAHIALAITASLITRPIGAFLFGLLADRYGRRIPLMLDILFYSVVEFLCGFAPNFTVFLILRLLYGIGMGGEWGVGASLALESVPAKWRGVLSGALQEGYALGYLLAAIAYWTVFPHWGWRALFFLGGAPALLSLFIFAKVKESGAWIASRREHHDWIEYANEVFSNGRRFLYLVLLMAVMNFISHGTQDLYPTFLQQQRGFSTKLTSIITVVSMLGAISGGLSIGLLSDRWGRRRSMAGAVLGGITLIPLWVFAPSLAWILIGAFALQFMVQGAWGVIPAHINELSPDRLRGFFPGFAYQIGVVIASASAYIEIRLAHRVGYASAMAIFAGTVLIIGAVVILAGPEAHRITFGRAASESTLPESGDYPT
jgi:MFS transporter, SHS family, lactate transporter